MSFIANAFTNTFDRVTETFGKVNAETPQYEVVYRQKNPEIEIRRYPQRLTARTEYIGDDHNGFRALYDYFTQNNQVGKEQPAHKEKLKMTAPVIRNIPEMWMSKKKTMEFLLPKKYQSIDQAPIPTETKRVCVSVFPEQFLAVRGMSNLPFAAGPKQVAEELRSDLLDNEVFELFEGKEPLLLQYNPPWAIGLLRRVEVAWEVKRRHKGEEI